MNIEKKTTWMRIAVAATAALALANLALAQDYPPPYSAPLTFAPAQLDSLVSRIALYPDPLLAQILAASTFPDQIQPAADYSFSHQNLQGEDLANAMWHDNLPWDASVQALIPFPSVMDMMVKDMNWTTQLGNTVLAQRPDVMDAVQRMRRLSSQYGYLQSNAEINVVAAGPVIEILPVDPGIVYVPAYNPYVVFAPPRPGFFVAGAIGFRSGFAIGAGFGNFGWGGGFNWTAHTVVVNHAVWGRTSANRGYVVNRPVNNFYARNSAPAQAPARFEAPAANRENHPVSTDRGRGESRENLKKSERR